jgi:hypothetical protein
VILALFFGRTAVIAAEVEGRSQPVRGLVAILAAAVVGAYA